MRIVKGSFVEGSFEYQTDRESLLELLREKTDLSEALGADRLLHRLTRCASGRLQACLEDVFPAPIACGAATVQSAALSYARMQPEASPQELSPPPPSTGRFCFCCCLCEGEVWRGAAPSKRM